MLSWIAAALMTASPAPSSDPPLLIAHRGASAERPEHTLEAYRRAIELGVDYIEPDLVATSDGHLIARHEAELSGTTDVGDHPEYADRMATRSIDGRRVTGWFAEDFTLAEIRTLRAKERLPLVRPANTRHDGRYRIPTFAEIVALARRESEATGRTIGVYPELKHPTYLAGRGFDVTAMMAAELQRLGLDGADAPLFVQCFEMLPLQRLSERVETPLILLFAAEGGPADAPGVTYAELAAPERLRAIARFATGIGVSIRLLVDDALVPTTLVADAHEAGLQVHAWTLRAENAFLPEPLRSNEKSGDIGNYAPLWRALIDTGADGFFVDNLREWNALQRPASASPSAPSPAE
ncbi:glycerophosphodiester phosphodiesterase family protein [Sphingomicrobium sp. XHP0239]|uniref:glycerophosphodiester phosphodiesterase family protein n=1 Tax=Sphingomicrobium maritimum TaxID=3133972 RepID=UPI0031CC88DA